MADLRYSHAVTSRPAEPSPLERWPGDPTRRWLMANAPIIGRGIAGPVAAMTLQPAGVDAVSSRHPKPERKSVPPTGWGSGASRALKARKRISLMYASIMVSTLGPRLFAARPVREAGLVLKENWCLWILMPPGCACNPSWGFRLPSSPQAQQVPRPSGAGPVCDAQ